MQDDVNAFVEWFTLEGAATGPLAGRSFGAKDLFDVAGHVTGGGNPEWARTHSAAEGNARAIDTLLGAGATLTGKTHSDELAYSLMGANAHYGTPVNSADPRRVPGGSSSGSAAAVAAGLVDIGLGTDTGGSVRLPASFCGLWGLRTSFGAVPLDGVLPFTRSYDTVGWLTRSGALMAEVAEAFGGAEGPEIRRLLLPVDIWARAEPACVAAIGPALARLQEHLGPVTPVVLASQGLETWREVFRICQAGEAWACLGEWISAHQPNFGPGIKERFEMAAAVDAESFAENNRAREGIRAHLRSLLEPGTVLVLPTSPAPAPLLTASEADLNGFRTRALEMLCPAGLAGLPQLSVPAGTVDGGPVGLSLVGAPGQDRQVIALARDAGLGDGAPSAG